MRTELDVLLGKIDDPALRADIASQVGRLRSKRTFGLVFEDHLPERVHLFEHPIRAGLKVVLRDNRDSAIYEVLAVRGKQVTARKIRSSNGGQLAPGEPVQDEKLPIASVVVIADFGDPIFPGLRHLGSVRRGGEKPAHVVIKGENHHVLEALQFTHAGRIDCIYIDPPYNSGARDWKYDNNYVDDNDAYRHSKWLAFMERRLQLAKQLLKPEDSVLIVTIDEKEYLRLGLLLEQTFPGSKVQMVSTLINPASVARAGSFGRSDEYIFFVSIGSASPQRVRLDREWVSGKGRTHTGNIRWDLLRRSGEGAARKDSPGCFYPIYVDAKGKIAHVGSALRSGVSKAPVRKGCVAVLPIRKNKTQGRWQWTPETLKDRLKQGRVRISGSKTKGYVVNILKDGEYKKIERGEFKIAGKAPDGSVIVDDIGTETVLAVPGSQWRISSHDATQYGSRLLTEVLLPGRKFPFPKSLYAVEDTLRFFVQDKPNAVILDFFGGSGTTAHAVARLNKQDGGKRQSIIVTNNEISPEEAEELREQGYSPGDKKWEAQGIFEYVTRPRITTAITGRTPANKPLAGDYKFTDEFPMSKGFEENVEFFELSYLDAEEVELNTSFEGVSPMLWLRAGAKGEILTSALDSQGNPLPFACTGNYGILFNPDRWRSFAEKLPTSARAAFVVTDSQTTFSGIISELPTGLDTVRLYENYLSTFTINRGHF
jgi:adenine-specific DNA-methyltransferase